MRLLTARMLKAVVPFVTKETSRYTLNAVRIGENEVQVTDGHRLVSVSNPTEDKQKNFPVIEGFTPNGFQSCLMPIEMCKRLIKAIPSNKVMPILNHAAVTYDGSGTIKAAVTDLDNPQVISGRVNEGQFPNVAAVIPNPDKAVATIRVNASYLKELAASAALYADNVTLRFYGPENGLRLDTEDTYTGEKWLGVVMPVYM